MHQMIVVATPPVADMAGARVWADAAMEAISYRGRDNCERFDQWGIGGHWHGAFIANEIPNNHYLHAGDLPNLERFGIPVNGCRAEDLDLASTRAMRAYRAGRRWAEIAAEGREGDYDMNAFFAQRCSLASWGIVTPCRGFNTIDDSSGKDDEGVSLIVEWERKWLEMVEELHPRSWVFAFDAHS